MKSCGGSAWKPYNRMPIGVHHYMDSYESFVSRQTDARASFKSKDKWLERSRLDQSSTADDELREWMNGFFDEKGETIALELLEGAGVAPEMSLSMEREGGTKTE